MWSNNMGGTFEEAVVAWREVLRKRERVIKRNG